MDVFVGIDVAKDRLDVAVRPSGESFVVARTGAYARIRAPTFPTFDSPPAATSCNRNKIISSV